MEVVKPVKFNDKYVVYFAQNSSEVTARAMETLDNIAPNTNVNIVATASPEGSATYNKKLSQARANAVKEYLESRGVNVTSAEGIGVDGPESNRTATVTIEN